MPKLENPKHEVFCHILARGNTPETAYVGAGYKRDPDAAAALMRIKRIAARIAELHQHYHDRYRKRVSPQTILKQRRDAENAQTRKSKAR